MRRYELVTVVTNGHRIEGRRGLILAFFGKILAFFGNKRAILQLFTGVTDGHSGHRWSQMVTGGHSWSQNRRGLGVPVDGTPLFLSSVRARARVSSLPLQRWSSPDLLVHTRTETSLVLLSEFSHLSKLPKVKRQSRGARRSNINQTFRLRTTPKPPVRVRALTVGLHGERREHLREV